VSRAPFRERLADSIAFRGAALCVGLDPDPAQIPRSLGEGVEAVRRHTLAVIEATSAFAAAYKPNLAFYERFGGRGFEVLAEVVQAAGGMEMEGDSALGNKVLSSMNFMF